MPVHDGAGAAHPPGTVRRLLGRAAGYARGVRPRVWVTAGTALVLLTAAIVLLPGRGAQAEGTPTASWTATTTATRDASAVRSPSAPPAARPRPQASVVAASADAAAAATALLSIRDSCLAAHDEGCLRPIEDVGSPVAVRDADALAGRLPPVRVPHGKPVVRDRSGATATVGIGPATVLLIRQRDRWLIRDVVVPPG